MTKKNDFLPLSIAEDFSGYQHKVNTCIDWMQIDSRGVIQKCDGNDLKDTGKSTPVFKKIYEFWQQNYYVASIVSEPIMKELPQNLNLIKLINRELYYYKPVERINKISNSIGLLPYRPSRIDFAIDFNTFLGGYKPDTLIKDFFKCKYLKKGHTRFIIQGNQTNITTPHYLKFSQKHSNVDTYLYNKSKELVEVKNKPWIRKAWENAGFDTTQDVWRLEFAVHNPRFNFINKTTGESGIFNYVMLDDKEYLNNVIGSLINKYFDFRRNTGIKEIADMPKVKLFHFINDFTIQFDKNTAEETDRGDRLFLRKLKELNNEIRKDNIYLSDNAVSIINYFKKTRQI